MVGVPGKYKGCETCRRRRVKCSNERPLCKKCLNSGRDCEGYERERVFITGTLESKGRVASHPKKSGSNLVPSRREEKQWRRSSSHSEASSSPSAQPPAPYSSAWDECIPFSVHGNEYLSTMMALHTKLDGAGREPSEQVHSDEGPFKLSLQPYRFQELQPSNDPKEFHCEAQYLQSLTSASDNIPDLTDSYHVFLYEHNYGATAAWDVNQTTECNKVRSLGPQHFQTFPHHHFFARVFRPTALCIALLSRQETFLAMPEWNTKPWEHHSKTLMDHLIDIALFLPSLFARADEILLEAPTINRRSQAQDLLQNCLTVDRQFDQWLVKAIPGTVTHPVSYWPQDPCPSSMLPFPYAWAFKDEVTGIMFLYYWMTQILFHRCISDVHSAIFEPAMDAYADVWPPPLPPALEHLDMTKYQQTREMAANICRGLDSVLSVTGQPDLVLGPLRVATDLYGEVNEAAQDAILEAMWLEGFRERVRARGQQVSNTLQGQQWLEVGRV